MSPSISVADAVRTKRAVRQFQETPLSEEAVRTILNAGRRAQSAKNMQAWHFIAIQDRARLRALSTLGTWAGHLAGAALGVVLVTPPPEVRFSIMFDAGQAAAYMQLVAWEMGIGSCLATIYEIDACRALLGFPADMEARIALSFGFPRDTAVLTQPPQMGGRRQFDEVVHMETW